MKLADVHVKSIGLASATLEVSLSIYNPNSITATLDRVTYSLYANGIYLGDGTLSRTDIPPGSTITVSAPFTLSGALSVLWSCFTTGGEVTWRVKGTAYFDTPLGSLTTPFDIVI
ncbi:MAG: LEA type 2 family protein [Candidatus Methanosuratincola petrocarbonis]